MTKKRILWVTSQELPLISENLNTKQFGFGGWVMNMLNQLKHHDDIILGVAMVSKNVKKIWSKECAGIMCYVAPDIAQKAIDDQDRDYIINDFAPDIIHIEGNEFQIHNSFSKIKDLPVLLSLQGILSGYEPYQYGQIELADKMFSWGDAISAWVLFFRKKFRFNDRMELEFDTISNVKYITGRTYWDRAHSYWINSKAKYYTCCRILRPEFYNMRWSYDKCNKHTLFVGNGYSPLKGVHNVLKAVFYLKNEYPDIKVNVAGHSPIINYKFYDPRGWGYSAYIKRLIKKYDISSNIEFVGHLHGNKMMSLMSSCNAYVLPSLIENSPNTLGEAMLMGMPCVSAYTGGSSEMAIDEKECLFYRANDPKLLAWQIKRLFDNPNLGIELGNAARLHAAITHDPERNTNMLLQAYADILNENKK